MAYRMGNIGTEMKYNFQHHYEVERARDYLNQLIEKKALAEITKVSPRRSLNQNSYLHLLISAFGAHFGYTLAEAKQIYKELSPDVYNYEKRGRTFYRSSAELTKSEMARSIDRFREKSAEAGYPLPDASQREWLDQLSNSVEQAERYL